jgi:hypothetical protein
MHDGVHEGLASLKFKMISNNHLMPIPVQILNSDITTPNITSPSNTVATMKFSM